MQMSQSPGVVAKHALFDDLPDFSFQAAVTQGMNTLTHAFAHVGVFLPRDAAA